MADNPFKAIAEIYNESVKEQDNLGYAETFKECTEKTFKSINESFTFKDNPIHFTDVEYLDGYFIFGHGTNSVVHFHIQECPGWKFGIWWYPKAEGKNNIKGDFFAQYEETIDKFKPSASIITHEIICYDSHSTPHVWEVEHDINFIKNEPYLAFCRDYCFWDYNHEYHTREEAEEIFNKWKDKERRQKEFEENSNNKVLKFVINKILPMFKDAYIHDNSEYCSPRYDVIAPYESNKDLIEKPGVYDWFDEEDKECLKIKEEWEALKKELNDQSNTEDLYYYIPIHDVAFFIDRKENENE